VRLRQILLNLLSNAVKFTEEGDVTVSVSFRDNGGDSRIRFAVEDTGIGIAPEARKRLFRPFVQADDSISDRFGGTGLGLDITKRLTDLMGGAVEVESQEGVGSTFTVELPTGPVEELTAQSFQTQEAPPSDEPQELDARILVVEDSEEVREILREYVEEAGATVLEASNGFHGIDVEQRERESGRSIDAVLLDLQMPLMDGFETYQALRGRGFAGSIVAVTASDSLRDRDRCLEVGFGAVIPKPVDRHLLLRSLRESLSSARDGDSSRSSAVRERSSVPSSTREKGPASPGVS
jgi:CheY-like chemotaxis protein/anti-sigma regulatory factor (Ser/Thr protein kinase)